MQGSRLLQLEAMRAIKKVEETCESLHLWLSDDKPGRTEDKLHLDRCRHDPGQVLLPRGQAGQAGRGVARARGSNIDDGTGGGRGAWKGAALRELHFIHQGLCKMILACDRIRG